MRERTTQDTVPAQENRLPAWRIGLLGGLVGILCCVGPTVLALIGVVSAGTAFVWATTLYDNDTWWFRLAGLAVTGLLVWVALRRRNECSVAGVRRLRWRLLAVLGIAVATYALLYGVTLWLGTLA
jgi:LPXTG-motif cell wall-anchored protein